MTSRELVESAGALLAWYRELKRVQAHEYRFHKTFEAFLVALVRARGHGEYFLHVNPAKFGVQYRHLVIFGGSVDGRSMATVRINAKTREEGQELLTRRPPDKGLLADPTIWDPRLIGLITMAFWHLAENSWADVDDRKRGKAAIAAYAALEWEREDQLRAYRRKMGFPQPDQKRIVQIPAPFDPAPLFPGRSGTWVHGFLHLILRKAANVNVGFPPDYVPIKILQERGDMTVTQAIAKYLVDPPPKGAGLKKTLAARAMGYEGWRSIRDSLDGAKTNLHSGRRKKLKALRKAQVKPQTPGLERVDGTHRKEVPPNEGR